MVGLLGANTVLVSAAPGVLSKEILEKELTHLFEGEWDWQVEKLGDDMYLVTFPTSNVLWMATRSGKLYLFINDITADIHESVLAQPKGDEMPEV